MHRRLHMAVLGMIVSSGIVGCATRRPQPEPVGDVAFLRQAAEGHLAEIAAGRVAAERGNDSRVKVFGQQMVDEHTVLYDQLVQVARQKDITPPIDPPERARDFADRLRRLTGQEFDRTYLQQMVTGHEQDIARYQQEVNRGRDPDVVAYAGRALPKLQEHLRMARDLVKTTAATAQPLR